MSPHPSLNAFTPGTWARVVSGVVWADYAVNEGRVTAKTARGPLALLSLTGEGEDLPRLHAPTPDALEVEAHRLNSKAHFLAFRRCAQGRRKGQGGRRVGFLRLWRGPHTWRQRRENIWRALDSVDKAAQTLARRLGPTAFRMARARRARRILAWQAEIEAKESRLYSLAPGLETVEVDGKYVSFNGVDNEAMDALKRNYEEVSSAVAGMAEFRKDCKGLAYYIGATQAEFECFGQALTFALAMGDSETVLLIFHNLNERRLWRRKLREAVALLALERAAYRAHVTRRVRPPARRSRIPRPIHARPRPPTCPAAPPALPAPVC